MVIDLFKEKNLLKYLYALLKSSNSEKDKDFILKGVSISV